MSKKLSARLCMIPELSEWTDLGRLVCVKIVLSQCDIVIIAVYGFPSSHERYADNEALQAQIVHWAAGLSCAVLIAGDMNSSSASSPLLAMPDRFGLWRVTPEVPTTRDKKGHPSRNLALDHILVNSKMMDLSVQGNVRHDVWVSDHFPVCASWVMPDESYPTWCWPQPMKLGDKSRDLRWKGQATMVNAALFPYFGFWEGGWHWSQFGGRSSTFGWCPRFLKRKPQPSQNAYVAHISVPTGPAQAAILVCTAVSSYPMDIGWKSQDAPVPRT